MHAIPFTVTFPGSSLDLGDSALENRTQQMLTLGLDALVDSAIALGEYRAVAYSFRVFSDAELRTITTARERIETEIRGKGIDTGERRKSEGDELMQEVHRRLVPKMMSCGIKPALFESRPPFIHARTFVLSIEMLRRTFVQIELEPGTANLGASARKLLDAAVPGLVGVRHSVAHADERMLQKRRGKTIHPKAIEHGAVRSKIGGVMMLGSLISDCFGYTTETGEYAEVPIKLETLRACVETFQTMATGFRWRGTPHVVPAM